MRKFIASILAALIAFAIPPALAQNINPSTQLRFLAPCVAFSVVFTGTTATNGWNCAAGPGTSGQPLVSGGAGVLPAFSSTLGNINTGNITLNGGTALTAYAEGTWTPTFNSFTFVGGTTTSGRWTRIGRMVFATFQVSGATSVASNAGTSNVSNLPFVPESNASANYGNGGCVNGSVVSYGNGEMISAAAAFYTPTWSATPTTVSCSFMYNM